MSRSLTATFIASLMAGRTSEIYHTLIVLSGVGISTKRYVDDYENVTSNGQTYTAAAFAGRLPNDVEDQIPSVNIVFDNVDRTLMTDIRSATGPPEIEINLVLQSDPDTVEIGPLEFTVRAVDYNKMTVSGTLQYEDILNETIPDHRYSPQLYPGLFP
jgi:hypothetical protein